MAGLGARLKRGALHGIEIFLWYALAEYLLLAVSLVVRSHRAMLIEQWRGTVVLFVCYVVLGALAGMVVGSFVRAPDDSHLAHRSWARTELVFVQNSRNSWFKKTTFKEKTQ